MALLLLAGLQTMPARGHRRRRRSTAPARCAALLPHHAAAAQAGDPRGAAVPHARGVGRLRPVLGDERPPARLALDVRLRGRPREPARLRDRHRGGGASSFVAALAIALVFIKGLGVRGAAEADDGVQRSAWLRWLRPPCSSICRLAADRLGAEDEPDPAARAVRVAADAAAGGASRSTATTTCFSDPAFRRGLLNSVIIAGVDDGRGLVLGAPAAYALARLRLPRSARS